LRGGAGIQPAGLFLQACWLKAMTPLVQRATRLLLSLAGVGAVTFVAFRLIPVNATTAGLAFLLLVLAIASMWGFPEALLASVAATLAFNLFFLPPIGKLTIADPQNWIALFSFLVTALIASRLSAEAKRRAQEAIEHQQDVERLYTFSRAILLIDSEEPFPKQLARKLAEIFQFSAIVLFDRRTGEFYRQGPAEFDGMDEQLREAALHGTFFSDEKRHRVITAVRLGSEPIASLALQGAAMGDAVLQGIANLVAIGLERARAQDLAHQFEAARQSEQLRTALIDAMAHEFKTPLTSIRAATTSLLASPEELPESKTELLRIADEEADRLQHLIDDAVEMARLDTAHIEVHLENAQVDQIVREVVTSMQTEIEDRPVEVVSDVGLPANALDRRLVRLAIRQLLDNAMKYSPPHAPVRVHVHNGDGVSTVEVTDRGQGIPMVEQQRIFERFYRSPVVKDQVPGSGLGLSIAHSIARAHGGDLTVTSRPGETTFRLTLPLRESEAER
jgi:two-component system sensor histidine kinase KdpD